MISSFKWRGEGGSRELGDAVKQAKHILSLFPLECSFFMATKFKENTYHNQVQMLFFNLKLSVCIISTGQCFLGMFCHT